LVVELVRRREERRRRMVLKVLLRRDLLERDERGLLDRYRELEERWSCWKDLEVVIELAEKERRR